MVESEAVVSSRPVEFDLEDRSARFGEAVVALAKGVPANRVTNPILDQLVRAAGSVGANYGEADDAESKKDFRHKIGLCRKEAREAKHWLRMLVAAHPECRETARALWREANELNLIFSKIFRSCAEGGGPRRRGKDETRNPKPD
jgi:four helix bundle protein